MILLFLAGLTKLNDPWTQCVLSTPYVYHEKGSSKAERMCTLSNDQILWINESQNMQARTGDVEANPGPTLGKRCLCMIIEYTHITLHAID